MTIDPVPLSFLATISLFITVRRKEKRDHVFQAPIDEIVPNAFSVALPSELCSCRMMFDGELLQRRSCAVVGQGLRQAAIAFRTSIIAVQKLGIFGCSSPSGGSACPRVCRRFLTLVLRHVLAAEYCRLGSLHDAASLPGHFMRSFDHSCLSGHALCRDRSTNAAGIPT